LKLELGLATDAAAAMEAGQAENRKKDREELRRAREDGIAEGLALAAVSAHQDIERKVRQRVHTAAKALELERIKTQTKITELCAVKTELQNEKIRSGMFLAQLSSFKSSGEVHGHCSARSQGTRDAELLKARAEVAELNTKLLEVRENCVGGRRASAAPAATSKPSAYGIIKALKDSGRYPTWLLSLLCDLVVKAHVPLRNVPRVLDICFTIHTGGRVPDAENQVSQALAGKALSRLGYVDQKAYAKRNSKYDGPVCINSDTGNKKNMAREVVCVGRWEEEDKVNLTHP